VGAGILGAFRTFASIEVGRGGSGLFGGSEDGDPGLPVSNLRGGGLLGDDSLDSFVMGDGGIASVSPFPSQAPVSGRASPS